MTRRRDPEPGPDALIIASPGTTPAEGKAALGRLTCVVWEDTTSIASWLTRPELAEFARDGAWRCRNVGWITHEDDTCIVLSGRLSEDAGRQVGLSERIPKRSIIERYDLDFAHGGTT